MAEPANMLLIEGSFEELAEELAQYLDNARKPAGGEDGGSTHADVMRFLAQNQKDEVLKKLVMASACLNSVPEREFIQSYNLLIHLVRQSPSINIFLPRICQNLSNPVTSSPSNGASMALTILTTIFNILQADNDVRYHVFLAIISVVKANGIYDSLRPQLKHVDRWIAEWESDEEEQQKLFLEIAMVADDAGEAQTSYQYLVRALRTIPSAEISNAQARKLSLRALRSALVQADHFDFSDLMTVEAIQSLGKTDPIWFELLEIFHGKLLDDYEDFRTEHDDDDHNDSEDDDDEDGSSSDDEEDKGHSWLERNGLSDMVLTRKIRLLTLASLAASSSTTSRSLPYSTISRALQIPSDDVEMWVIDVIRAGLVEGKLSQSTQTFLIHRATHRIFALPQWRQLSASLALWHDSLRKVLDVLRAERVHVESNRDGGGTGAVTAHYRQADDGRAWNGMGGGGGGGGGAQRRGQREMASLIDSHHAFD